MRKNIRAEKLAQKIKIELTLDDQYKKRCLGIITEGIVVIKLLLVSAF